MIHTRLTPANFSGYALTVLSMGLITVGFGAVDLAMVAPLGAVHVAAVGQGELIAVALGAFLIGVVDVYSARLAVAEGEGRTATRLPVLVAALLVVAVPVQLLSVALVAMSERALLLIGQDPDLVPLVGDYLAPRIYGMTVVIVCVMAAESLKICGFRGNSVAVLVSGLITNAGLNWVFLHATPAGWFDSPESAVATATVAAQLLMAVVGAAVFVRRIRTRPIPLCPPSWTAIRAETTSMARVAPGVGARHLNDYAGSVVPLMFIGTMGVRPLAAAVVATKIFTLFCRVPQACFSAAFVHYGYALGRRDPDLPAVVRRLRRYAAVPTGAAVLATVVLSPWLVTAFAPPDLDLGLARWLMAAYLITVPAYFFEQFAGELLTVHQRGGRLAAASTIATYVLTIPLAGWAVFAADSAFLGVATKTLSIVLLAGVFWRLLGRELRAQTAVPVD